MIGRNMLLWNIRRVVIRELYWCIGDYILVELCRLILSKLNVVLIIFLLLW